MRFAQIEEWQSCACKVPSTHTDGDKWLRETLQTAEDQSITFVCTASLSNLADILKRGPELARKIRSIVWMAGAIDVDGNLDREIYDGWNDKAEWNVFADSESASWVFEHTQIEIMLFPLDIADKVPIQGQFMEELRQQMENGNTSVLNEIIYRAYAEICMPQPYYRLWDTVAVGWIAMPELYAPPKKMELAIVTDAKSEGWTAKKGDVESNYWREVNVFFDFNSSSGQQKFIHMVATHNA